MTLRLEPRDLPLLRASVVVVWLATALVSVIELHGQSLQLLHSAGLRHPGLTDALIWGGIAVDVALGLALWLRPGRPVYLAALGMLGLMTLVASVLLPALWLHPLGPLLKNLPIAALLWVLAQESSRSRETGT